MKNFKPSVFYKQVKEELSKVNWPTREATVRTSAVVLVVVGLITAYLGVVDAIVSRLAAVVIG
ncbi:MAG: preprotein translocase subunit SecE [Deferribacterales bacterium]|nr:preprotein translocase subunit SecE [Deferribacterales bacterium]